ncbi:MAG TPA: hypothetical protein DDY86_11650 [Syntrophaceae bacterium]|nr:hypothetical protein [Syntrophaceae bacterium]
MVEFVKWSDDEKELLDEWIKENPTIMVSNYPGDPDLNAILTNRTPGAIYARWWKRTIGLGVRQKGQCLTKKIKYFIDRPEQKKSVLKPWIDDVITKENITTETAPGPHGSNEYKISGRNFMTYVNGLEIENTQLKKQNNEYLKKLRSMCKIREAAECLFDEVKKYNEIGE